MCSCFSSVRCESTSAPSPCGRKRQRAPDRSVRQEFVAEALGVSRQAVSKWESGASDPSTANLIALAKLFGTTPEELLKEIQ